MKTNKPHIIFICNHCDDQLMYILKDELSQYLPKLLTTRCPNCNQEPDNNWVLYREGDHEEERLKPNRKSRKITIMTKEIKNELLKTLSLN